MENKILVTGANGQLGRCFAAIAAQYNHTFRFIFATSNDLDITKSGDVARFFDQHQISWCINCAAYTAVDKAESDAANARKVNTNGPKHLAEACAARNIPMIHYSTDYVYHSRQNTPFKEGDKESPKGVYARTKLAGEKAALKAYPAGVMVIRTSWVYAAQGANFVQTMLRLGAERTSLKVVFDQIGTPTFAPDLAEATLQIIQKIEKNAILREKMGGIWHYSNEGVTSWYDFAKAIMEIKGLNCAVFPIESSQYPTPAQRPPFSVLNKEKIKLAFDLPIPHWRESLIRCLTPR